VDRFIGRFVRGGMEAFVPVPPTATPAHKYSETWGACPEGWDLEILTTNSLAAVEFRHESEGATRPHIPPVEHNWVNLNNFTIEDHAAEIASLNLPAFLGQDQIPAALIVFYTKWKLPHLWIESVINKECEYGLVLHMESYDISDNLEMFVPTAAGTFIGGSKHFHFYTSEPGTDWIQSGHCAALIKEYDAEELAIEREGWASSEMNTDDGADDVYLPSIDSEGNEIPDDPHATGELQQ
jgi:hypothetical protein